MGPIASLITSLTSVYSTVHPGTDQRKHQGSASLAFVRGIHRRLVNSPHKWPVTRKIWWRHHAESLQLIWISKYFYRVPVDSIYCCPVCKWVAETWLHMTGHQDPSAPIMACYIPKFMFTFICSLGTSRFASEIPNQTAYEMFYPRYQTCICCGCFVNIICADVKHAVISYCISMYDILAWKDYLISMHYPNHSTASLL